LEYLKPNFEIEVAQFFDWLETQPNMGASAIVLWLAIMETWRKARYPDQLTVAISTLEVKTRLKSTAIKQARDVLIQSGQTALPGNFTATKLLCIFSLMQTLNTAMLLFSRQIAC